MEEAKSHLEVNAVEKVKASLSEGTSLLYERQKAYLVGRPLRSIPSMNLLTARRTVRRFAEQKRELRKAFNSAASKKSVKHSISARRTSTLQYGPQNSCGFSALGSWHNQNEQPPLTTSSIPSKNGSFLLIGKFGHWRSQCPLAQHSGAKGNSSGNR